MIDVEEFVKYAKGKVLIAGYGSLLSHASRRNHSQIDCQGIGVRVADWQRSWITRSVGEQQTYVGAVPLAGASLNAQLIALEFDESFQTREQDYRFSPLSPQDIMFEASSLRESERLNSLIYDTSIFICETLDVKPSNKKYPVNYSYIFTCLLGAYETNGLKGAQAFLDKTEGWETAHLYNDLLNPMYPRHGIGEKASIDMLIPVLSAFIRSKA